MTTNKDLFQMDKFFNSRKPYYNDESDYQTNSPSYYDDLGRFRAMMKHLAEKVGHYDIELQKRFDEWDLLISKFPENVEKLLIEWLESGVLEEIINKNIFKDLNTKIDNLTQQFNIHKDEYFEFVKMLNQMAKRLKIIYTVGSEGDFLNLNDALKHINNLMIYPQEVEVKLLNDYVMNEQVKIYDKDFSFVHITAVNTVTCEVNSTISKVTSINGTAYTPFFHIKNGGSPKISALFKQITPYNNVLPRITGCLVENAHIIITEKNGFTHFSWGGLVLLDRSSCIAIGGNFSHNGNYKEVIPDATNVRTAYEGKGVLVQNSDFTGDRLIADYCGDVGVHVQLVSNARFSHAKITYCGHHAVVVSQSSDVTARNGNFSFTQDDNVVCETGSNLDISYSTCNNSFFTNGIVSHSNGNITFMNGIANNNKGWGIHAVNDGHVSAEGGTTNNNGSSGISTGRMGYVYFRYGTSKNNGQSGINISSLSHVIASNTEISGNKSNGITNIGGEVDCSESKITLNKGHGVGCYSGGKVRISGVATLIDFNNYGVLCETGEIILNECSIKNNTNSDVRVAKSGRVTGTNVVTTDTKKAMYVVSSGGVIHVNDSVGFANMDINVIQVRGLVISNTLKKEVVS